MSAVGDVIWPVSGEESEVADDGEARFFFGLFFGHFFGEFLTGGGFCRFSHSDLEHPNQFVVGMSLCALGNISNAEMARDIKSQVEELMGHTNPYIRKKATLCAVHFIRKDADLVEDFLSRIRPLLADRNHGVLLTGVRLLIEMCGVDPEKIPTFRRLVPNLIRILKNLVQSNFAPEHDVSGVTDPFIQVSVLRLLRILGTNDSEASEQMNDILAEVATNTESAKNVGNAVVYEAVLTILAIESESGLRKLAINILGRFLVNRDNNIRYVALNTLAKVLHDDISAVQRHRHTIVECLKDHDISIRRRALDLVYALVNDNNIRTLTRELLNYLVVADEEFKPDLSVKIVTIIERYAPNVRWQFDQLLKAITLGGKYLREDVPASFRILILQNQELQAYAVTKLFLAVTEDTDAVNNHTLLDVALWAIGEYGDYLIAEDDNLGEEEDPVDVSEDEVIELLENMLTSPNVGIGTRRIVLTSLVKLSTRFEGFDDKIKELLSQYNESMDIELQQRSWEFVNLFEYDEIRAGLTTHIPPYQAKVLSRRAEDYIDDPAAPKLQSAGGDDSDEYDSDGSEEMDFASGSSSGGAQIKKSTGSKKASNNNNDDDDGGLIVFGGEEEETTSSGGDSGAKTSTPSGAAGLEQLLGVFGGSSSDLLATNNNSGGGNNNSSGGGGDLLGMLGGGSGGVSNTGSSPAMGVGGGDLMSLLGGGPVNNGSNRNSNSNSSNSNSSGGSGDGIPSMDVYNKNNVNIRFDFMQNPSNPAVTQIVMNYSNGNNADLQDFVFQVAVPGYIKLQMKPASSKTVPAGNGANVTQRILINNTQHGSKGVAFKFKLSYSLNGQGFEEQGMLDGMPKEL
eukprot:TRINITY_DN2092_c0_g1_i5.p1 TRINITY_DN2092_c0_g1~~TRINITY_DN2092_c0_g1_i5.p1  ORF type:complete len:853 (+),score=360.77 TRINITY_DN2092_c0_g1_i5:1896-4454(+)